MLTCKIFYTIYLCESNYDFVISSSVRAYLEWRDWNINTSESLSRVNAGLYIVSNKEEYNFSVGSNHIPYTEETDHNMYIKKVKLSLQQAIGLWEVEAPTFSRQSAHRLR
jgi:hypothetical protein